MALYYVRTSGNDANAGTSAGAAWRTIGKALGAAGIASGDTVYIGGGVYREAVTVNMTSAVAETFVIGDVDGSKTGDAGEVVWTPSPNPRATPTSAALTTNARDFLTFQKLSFVPGMGSSSNGLVTLSSGSTDITFRQCALFGINNQVTIATINGTPLIDAASNWTFDSCIFAWSGSFTVILTAPTSTVADYDMNIVFKNCICLCGADFIKVNTSGSNLFKPGGVDIINCTCMAVVALRVNSANASTSIPCTVYNSLLTMGGGGTGLIANTSGQIIEDYNVINAATPRSNVAVGLHSTVNQEMYLSIGQEWLYGMLPRPTLSPAYLSIPVAWGAQAGGPTTDLLSAARPMGPVRILASGTATSGAAKSITDTGAAFGTLNGFFVKLTGGTGSGQIKHIDSNTATVLTVDSNWITNPDGTSVYVIYSNPPAIFGKATAGAATTLTVSSATWGTNAWTGFTVEITAGTGVGGIKQVASNTATVLTVDSAWSVNPDATSEFKLYRQTNENTINYACGALEAGPFALKGTATVRTGSNALELHGPSFYDFQFPVDNVSTTITVYGRFDSVYAGTKPQMLVLNGTEINVADATATMTGAADTWEQLSLTFTPNAKGVVTIRLRANSTAANGKSFFDDFGFTSVDATSFDHYRRLQAFISSQKTASGGGLLTHPGMSGGMRG